jgi:glycosyltransferase involved in cell wall biosynthesis
MRIGIDATALPPRPVGAGHYIIQLIRAFARQPGDDEFIVFVQCRSLPLLNLPLSASVRLATLPDQSPPLRLAWEQAVFPWLAARQPLDVLHSLHYTLPLAYSGRRVVTLHDMTFFLFPQLHTLPKRYFFRFFIHASARLADALVADSESTRLDAIRLAHIPSQKIFTAQLGVTPDFHPVSDVAALQTVRQKYYLPERFVLCVGLIEPRKNIPTLLHAFAQITAQFPDQRLVLVGRRGWMVETLEQQIASLGLAGKVIFPGYVAQTDLPMVYNLADICVYPSLYEGFGLPVLEALACGTPVITSNVSSMPEIVGPAGLLLPPTDSQALAAALQRLLSDPAERQRLAAQGPARAARFTWQRTAEHTRAAYHHALNR